jgi:NADH-quinone oxidoreductase subunit J
MEIGIFLILAAVIIISALLVIVQKNPVASALFLIVTMCALAIIFLMLQATFLAAIQIIVYAGAIVVLFLFVIMLLNLRKDEFGPEKKKLQRGLAILFAFLFFIEIAVLIKVGISQIKIAETQLAEDFGTVQALGKLLFTKYLLPFEITSVLLLVAMVGAVLMAKKKL